MREVILKVPFNVVVKVLTCIAALYIDIYAKRSHVFTCAPLLNRKLPDFNALQTLKLYIHVFIFTV